MIPSVLTAGELSVRLRAGLAGLFEVSDTTHGVNEQAEAVRFRGRLLVPSEEAYEPVRVHFNQQGYTPLFHREGGQDVIIAMPGVIETRPSNPRVNIVMFLLTVVSVLFVGVLNNAALDRVVAGVPPAPDTAIGQVTATLQVLGLVVGYCFTHLAEGLPYAVPLLAILLCHEFGHYLMARRHGVAVTLPYFIPMPLPPLGTMGAAIVQKEPFRNRKVLFDIGVAGPLAGLVVAIPVVLIGLLQSKVQPIMPGGGMEGNSLLYLALKFIVFGRVLPGNGVDVYISPVAFAGWVGLLVTSFNLLPAGQLDGGHVAYVLFGERSAQLSRVVILILVGLGVLGLFNQSYGWSGWFLWAGMITAFGQGHPPALDEITQIDPKRRALAWAMVVIFVLVFIPVPFSIT